MHFPQVNLNGTSKESLENQYREILHATNELIIKLRAAMPHGRDYPNGGLYEARDEMEERIRKVDAIEKEISEIAVGVIHQE